MKEFISKHLALICSVLIIPTLYAMGYLYDVGYLHQYGLSVELFKASADHYFIQAFYIAMKGVWGIYQHVGRWELLFYGLMTAIIAYTMFWLIEHDIESKIASLKNGLSERKYLVKIFFIDLCWRYF